jgi:hypothetical protein
MGAQGFGTDDADDESHTRTAEEHRMSGLYDSRSDRQTGHQKCADDFERSKHNSLLGWRYFTTLNAN